MNSNKQKNYNINNEEVCDKDILSLSLVSVYHSASPTLIPGEHFQKCFSPFDNEEFVSQCITLILGNILKVSCMLCGKQEVFKINFSKELK